MTMYLYPIEVIKNYLAEARLYSCVQQLLDYIFKHEESRIPVMCEDEVLLHRKINNERNDPYVS